MLHAIIIIHMSLVAVTSLERSFGLWRIVTFQLATIVGIEGRKRSNGWMLRHSNEFGSNGVVGSGLVDFEWVVMLVASV